jgi:hypothetical protein
MKRILIGCLSALVLASGTMTGTVLLTIAPSMGQFANVKQQLNSLPSSRIQFAKGASSANIQNAENHIYLLRARAGQKLTLKTNSLGARASVTLYGVNGKTLSPVFAGASGDGKTFSVRLPATGDYYIVGGSGTSNHFYDFTVTIK